MRPTCEYKPRLKKIDKFTCKNNLKKLYEKLPSNMFYFVDLCKQKLNK